MSIQNKIKNEFVKLKPINEEKNIEELNFELIVASWKGDLDQIVELLKKGANVNCVDEYKWTPIHYAILKGNVEVIEELIKNKANINLKDKDGQTELMLAAKKNKIEIIELLIKNGAEVNFKSNKNKTALMFAAEADNFEVVILLIEKVQTLKIRIKMGGMHYVML